MKCLFLVLIFIAAIVFGFAIAQDAGYALFVYHGWMVQVPFWFALLLLLLLFFLVYVTTRIACGFIFLKRSLRFWWLERHFYRKEIKK